MIPKKNQTLPSSVTIVFLGVLAAASLILNIGIFLKLESTPDGSASRMRSIQTDGAQDKQVVDGKVWVRLEDPMFEAYFLSDVSCTTCADLSQQKAAFEQAFPTANILEIGLDSDTAKKLIETGVSVVPAIILKKPFQNVQKFSQWAQAGLVTPIGDEYYEFRTSGNKKILKPEQLPPVAEGDNSIRVIGYVDYFAPETVQFISGAAQQIISTFGNAVAIDIRPLVNGIPAAFAAEAAACGADIADIAAVREQFYQAINTIVAGKQQLEEADVNQISVKLGELLALEGETATCYNEHRYAEAVQKFSAQAQALGITGAPAFFVGNRFLAGQQDPQVFIETIRSMAEEIQNQPAVETPPVEGENPENEMIDESQPETDNTPEE